MKASEPALQGAVTVAISWVTARLGVLFAPVILLMVMMALDYVTGMLAAKAEAIAHPENPEYGSKLTVRDDGNTLHISDSPTYRYEAPEYTQIGDGLWEIEDALTVAGESRVAVRDDGETLHITYKED